MLESGVLTESRVWRPQRSAPAEKSGHGRVDAELKVTGSMPYAADFVIEGCLQAVAVRSQHHHARIVSIDTQKPLHSPPLRDIITGADVADDLTGRGNHD